MIAPSSSKFRCSLTLSLARGRHAVRLILFSLLVLGAWPQAQVIEFLKSLQILPEGSPRVVGEK